MRKGVNSNFKLDGATASLRSVLIHEEPLMNSLFVLRASITSYSVSKASVVIDNPPSFDPSFAPEISEAYSQM